MCPPEAHTGSETEFGARNTTVFLRFIFLWKASRRRKAVSIRVLESKSLGWSLGDGVPWDMLRLSGGLKNYGIYVEKTGKTHVLMNFGSGE